MNGDFDFGLAISGSWGVPCLHNGRRHSSRLDKSIKVINRYCIQGFLHWVSAAKKGCPGGGFVQVIFVVKGKTTE